MDNNLNAKINNILSGLNNKELQNLVNAAKKSGIDKKLSQSDLKKIMGEFSKLDPNEIKRKISSVNSSEISKLSADELINKIKNL